MDHWVPRLKCQRDWSRSGLVMKLGGGDTADITLSFLSQTSSESHWEAESVRLLTAGPKQAGTCTPTHVLLMTLGFNGTFLFIQKCHPHRFLPGHLRISKHDGGTQTTEKFWGWGEAGQFPYKHKTFLNRRFFRLNKKSITVLSQSILKSKFNIKLDLICRLFMKLCDTVN